MNLKPHVCVSAAIMALSLLSPRAQAVVISQTYTGTYPGTITGTFPDQSSVLEEALNINADSDFTAYTTSYATGGFQPNLSLFNPSGIAIANQSAIPPSGAMPDPTTGSTFDGFLTAADLAPGTYTLTLTDFNLSQAATATNLSDGFTDNSGNGTTFVDFNGNARTGNYAVTVDVTPAAAPEPATISLLAPLFLIGLGVLRRKRFSNQL